MEMLELRPLHEATDTQLPDAPVSQATGHSSAMFCCTAVPQKGVGGVAQGLVI